MNWLDAVPALAVAVGLFVLPGLPVAVGLGARGITFLGLCVGGSVSVVGFSALLAPFIGMHWNVLVPFSVGIPAGAIVFLARMLWRRRVPRPDLRGLWGRSFGIGLAAIALAAVLIGLTVFIGIPDPRLPSQTYDAIFHLNAVQQVLDTGNGSPLALNLSAPMSHTVFYPAAWHDFASLIVELTGVPIVVAANVMSATIACFVWPVGCVFLVRQLAGTRATPILITGLFAAAFAAFPVLFIYYGVLYPNLLAYALIPIALGSAVAAVGKARNADTDPVARWVSVPYLIVGLGLAHPNAFFGLIVLAAPLLVQAGVEFTRVRRGSRSKRGVVAVWIAIGAAFVIAAVLWLRTGTTDNAWTPFETIPQAIGEAALNAPRLGSVPIVVTVFMLTGIAIIVRRLRTQLWLVIAWVLSVVLFVFAAAVQPGGMRTLVTGLWYNDSFRLAAFLVITALPLAVIGATRVADAVGAWLALRMRSTAGASAPRRLLLPGCAVIVTLALAGCTQGLSVAKARNNLIGGYTLSASSPVLSPDELAIFDLVDRVVPRDSVLAGNPWNGSGLAYAYTDRKVLFPHVSGAFPRSRWLIADDLSTHASAICPALRANHVQYVLDFGGPLLFGNDPRSHLYPGFEHLAQSPNVKLVAARGKAKLYRIVACENS